MTTAQVLFVAVGGALGAMMRYAGVNAATSLFGRDFPYGVLCVNLIGSCLIGVAYVLINERLLLGETSRALLVVGMLGAMTTFSTFSIDTLVLIESGALGRAAINVLANVGLCLSACWLGLTLTRQL